MADFVELPERYGFEILRSEVGSTLHGTGLEGGEDRDEMGIFLEWPKTTIGLGRKEHYEYRTQPTGSRSGPGDLDLMVYSARKWCSLALKGNPSVLLLLHAPVDKLVINTPFGTELRAMRGEFASLRAGKAFLGYMERQRQRMTGARGRAGRMRLNPDGAIDWKYAMHMLRLGYQGVEYLKEGEISLPMPEPTKTWLQAVRRGEIRVENIIKSAELLESDLKELLDGKSPLPANPNTKAIEDWLIYSHLNLWSDNYE